MLTGMLPFVSFFAGAAPTARPHFLQLVRSLNSHLSAATSPSIIFLTQSFIFIYSNAAASVARVCVELLCPLDLQVRNYIWLARATPRYFNGNAWLDLFRIGQLGGVAVALIRFSNRPPFPRLAAAALWPRSGPVS
jgi:hypothetical protein